MQKIEKQIQWYKQNSNSLYDDMVSIELEKINSLYDRYEEHTNEMFVEEMIESFCKIIEKQREKINELEYEAANDELIAFSGKTVGRSFIDVSNNQQGFQDDKELQFAFTQYCLRNGTSSYTVNDYCSRIKKTWKSYEDDYKNGRLSAGFSETFPEVPWDGILLNVYDNIDILGKYIKEKIDETNGNRNWLNARAALNKFDEFKTSIER